MYVGINPKGVSIPPGHITRIVRALAHIIVFRIPSWLGRSVYANRNRRKWIFWKTTYFHQFLLKNNRWNPSYFDQVCIPHDFFEKHNFHNSILLLRETTCGQHHEMRSRNSWMCGEIQKLYIRIWSPWIATRSWSFWNGNKYRQLVATVKDRISLYFGTLDPHIHEYPKQPERISWGCPCM